MTQITTTSLSLKNTIADSIISAIGNAGKLQIRTSGGSTLLCEFTLATPFGTKNASTGVITGGGTPILATASGTGTAAVARYTTSGGTTVLETNIGLGSIPFTVNTSTDVVTAPYANYANGDFVTFTGASLPAGITASTQYEIGDIADVGLITCNFKLYRNRALVDITTSGSGTITVNDNAGVQLNVGSPTVPSLAVSTGQVISIGSITINPPL